MISQFGVSPECCWCRRHFAEGQSLLEHQQRLQEEDFAKGLVYPHMGNISEVSYNVAVRVAEKIFGSGIAGVEEPRDIRAFIKSKMYEPKYQ